ncbi:MAG: DivIVA domain-containing protein [Actinomycetota bacterium]
MDDLSPLFHDIEFKERFRGYDVEEVDAYIDRVAKAAALVQGRIAELQNRVTAAEAQPREVVAASTAASEPLEVGDESLTKMLLLAQRTADAAIAEAEADGVEIRRQADEHASLVLAEAETDRRRMLAEAEAAVEQTVRTERERVAAEVAELKRYRAFLTDDIAILENHLEQSRSALQASAAALQHLVEAPDQFRTPAMPATSGVQIPAELVAEPAVDTEPLVDAESSVDAESADDHLDSVVIHEPVVIEAVDPAAPVFDPEPAVEVEVIEAEPIELAEPVVEAEPMFVEPVLDAEPVEFAEPVAEPEPIAFAEPVVEPEPIEFEVEPQGTVLWADDAAEVDGLTFDPGPMPDMPPAPLPVAEAAPVVDLTDEPIVLDGPPTAPTPIVDPDLSIVDPDLRIDEPVTGEWSDTGTHTAIAPPRLVTAADLETDAPVERDWIDDLRVEAGPATEAMPTVDERLLFDDPEPASSSEAFLEQLRDAVSGDGAEEFGEDALAAFFDGGEDDGGRTWFNRRR